MKERPVAVATARSGVTEVQDALSKGRARTLRLMAGLPESRWTDAVCPYLSPPTWDLGHIANFEELWLVQTLADRPELHDGFNDTYDAVRHARRERPKLRLLDPDGVRQYMDEVREESLYVLHGLEPGGDRLTRELFVHWLLVLHEHQHQETLLQTMQMHGPEVYRPPETRPLPAPMLVEGTPAGTAAAATQEAWCRVPGGRFRMGHPPGPGVYDNESPVHEVDVPAFEIARFPVTCGAFLRFIEAGGYDTSRHWSKRGRAWLDESSHHAPLYWTERDGTWHRRTLLGERPVVAVADEILCHVTYWEAEAYAGWAGARLPSEPEWEKACRHDLTVSSRARRDAGGGARGETGGTTEESLSDAAAVETQRPGRNPWGDAPATPAQANIGQSGWMPSRAGAFPTSRSAVGAEQMIGDVWEWTQSAFEPYPGFEAFPYKDYSETHFGGDFRVLRGGSWATEWGCANGTFRNWDHPHRRQIFAGIRLARDPP